MSKKELRYSKEKRQPTTARKVIDPQMLYPFPKKQIVIFIMLFTTALYFNTLWNQYALDDSIVIKENMFTQQGVAGIKKIMTTDVFLGFFKVEKSLVAGGRYRPLSLVTFAIEHQLWGDVPAVSHAINFLLYGLTGVFIFLFLSRLFVYNQVLSKMKYLPALAALFYIAHPIHTEAVANIKGRDEIMSMLFAMMSMQYLLKYYDEKKIYSLLIGAVCFMASLLSKENSITWVIIFPLTLYFFRNASLKSRDTLTMTLTSLIVAIIYLLLRNNYTNTKLNIEITEILNNPFYGATFEQRITTVIYTWGKYLILLIFPYSLSHDYYYNQIPWKSYTDIGFIASFLVYTALAVVALIQLKGKTLLSYCILFFGITFSIVSNLFFPIGTTMSERFVYMSSFGFTTYLAYLICLIPYYLKNVAEKNNLLKVKPVLAIALIVLLAYSIKTIARNPAWKDNYTLFSTDIQTSPNSAKLNNALGGTALEFLDKPIGAEEKKKYLQQARDALNKAISIYPKFDNAWLLLGNAALKGDSNAVEAIQYYVKSLEVSPNYPEAKNNLQVAINYLKEEERLNDLKKLYVESNYNATLGYYYAAQLRHKDKFDEALKILLQVIAKQPNFAEALSDAGLIYGQNKIMIDSSIYYLSLAVKANPDLEDANDNLSVAYGIKGDYQTAIQILQRAIQRNPDHAKYYMTMSATYRALGDNNMANYYAEEAKKHEQIELKQ